MSVRPHYVVYIIVNAVVFKIGFKFGVGTFSFDSGTLLNARLILAGLKNLIEGILLDLLSITSGCTLSSLLDHAGGSSG